MPNLQFRPSMRRQDRGAALIIVLCFVVLIAGLLVAFLFRATTERQVSNASAGGTKVELLTETALGIVVDDLKQEIISNSDVRGTAEHPIYIPKATASVSPVRDESTPALPNLIRRSNSADATTRASSTKSSAVSKNGRSVHVSRWNAHYLLPLANPAQLDDSSPDSSFVSPDWVLVSRRGPLPSPSWSKDLADASADNSNFVIGRYAFAIYDEGGLLDINAVGYPSSMTVEQAGRKGGTAFADLKQLSLTPSQIDQLVGWRNYASAQPSGGFGNFSFDASGANRFLDFVTDSKTNFLTVSEKTFSGETDRAIISRQQLIKFVKGLSSDAAQQQTLQNALQYLGTFTREVNAPTWGPSVSYSSPYNYKDNQFKDDSAVYNPFVLNVKVISSFTRADGSAAVVGEPLVKYRFPLEKLALLEKMQGVSSLSSQDRDDIARYFGLDPVNDSNGFFRHWSYPTASTKYPHDAGGILSLSDVAKKNREPDFFEMLQAGILSGSLGKGGGRGDVLSGGLGYSTGTFIDPDAKSTLQMLRIGANIIDQWDKDNYPTTISFPATGDSVYGMEDLPYLNKFLYTVAGPGNVVSPYNQVYRFSFAFQLWNPNQALASNTGAYPAGIQISPLNVPAFPDLSDSYQMGLVIKGPTSYPTWYWSGKNQAWTTGAYADYFGDLDSKGIINVPFTAPQSDYREPTASAALELKPMIGIPPDTVPKGAFIASQMLSANPRADSWIYFKTSTVYRIQFLDQSGTYRTYGTFVGLDNAAAPAPGTGYRQAPWLKFSNTPIQKWYSAPKSDPRTFRFGSGQSEDYDVISPNSSIAPGGTLANTSRLSGVFPFTGGSSTTNFYRIDKWASNMLGGSPSTPANPSYPDKDGQIRPGDAYYSTLSPLNNPANGGVPLRPVILNRPFRSVGELGYVFRDMPWKTLDMFSARSPDAALLDLFSLKGGQPLLAGRLNPNTRQKEVLAAVIAETLQKVGSTTTVSSANATAIGKAIVTLSKQVPFANRSELVTRLMDDPAIANISNIKTEREAVVRALADGSNTRTWNLLIDLIAQVGRYPDSATALDQFIVEGERHCWLHVAIDRFTGEIVDQQIEVVAE